MARHYTLQRHPSEEPARIDYAAELNPQQLAAVQAPPGPALVIAGAGSGKTRTLTYRVAYLLENGIAPSNILLLTFTNKAAREMLERVEELLPDRTAGLWGGTFHSIGNRILRRHPEAAGLRRGFSIMDREDQGDLLNDVIAGLGIDTKGGPKEKRFPKGDVVADILSFAVNTELPVEEVLAEKYPDFVEHQEKIEAVRKEYDKRKHAANTVDFDDLLTRPLRMLEHDDDLAQLYRSQFQFILVDEYQDTNRLQGDFIDVLAREHRNLMVVGDDAQSIYSWRGADFQNILRFPERYAGAQIYKIETNYRSVPEVLEVANAAIAANERQFKKHLRPAKAVRGVKPALVTLDNNNDQARFVTQRIRDLHEHGVALHDIAVLYRAHYHSMELQMELTRQGIPFSITSGLRFFEQAHIKDVAAFMKFAVNPHDEVAFKRMARLLDGVGAKAAEKLWTGISRALESQSSTGTADAPVSFLELLAGQKPPAKAAKDWSQIEYTLDEIAPAGRPVAPSKMLTSVIEAMYDDYMKSQFTNYESRREDLTTLTEFARQFDDPAAFLDQLALMSNVDAETAPTPGEHGAVTLSSIHQAKGLEWRTVFVIWMCEGMFPSGRSLEDANALEEERRLFYVAVTRAEEDLYLTVPMLRFNAGYGDMVQRPSRFLAEIPRACVEEWMVR